MTLSSPSLRRFVRRALVDASGVAPPDRAQLLAVFDTLCERLQGRLQPLFGTTAVSALFVRALHVAALEFPWLGEVPNNQEPCAVDRATPLRSVDLHTLEEGLSAVLAHNIGLLSAFVGEDLVFPLVQQAWGGIEPPRTEDDL